MTLPSLVRDGDLVGRNREMAVLQAWLAEAKSGAGRLVLCAGEPGIGKTRLARELAGAALAAGISVAWGRCVEDESAPTLWPWRQVFRALGAEPEALDRPVESPQDRFGALLDVASAVPGVVDGPALIVLDDLHWADEASLLVLRHLAESLADAPLLVLATHREPLPDANLARAPGVERLALRGFGLAEVEAQLALAGAPDPRLAAPGVLEATAGNPLFVREVARAIADGRWRADLPPATVLDAVRDRLARLSPDSRRLLQAAAVAGRDIRPGVLAGVLGQPTEQCLPLLDEAVAHALLEAGPDGHRFVHVLVREAIAASLGTAERVDLHRRTAQVMVHQFAADSGPHLAEIARHWACVAPYEAAETARDWAVRAAAEAVGGLDYAEGVRLYTSALRMDAGAADPWPEADRAGVQARLGRAAAWAGDVSGALAAAEAAAAAARRAARPDLLAEAVLVLEAVPDPSVNAVTRALCEEALTAATDPAVRARLLALRSHLAFYAGEQDQLAELSAQALAAARQSGDDTALAAALRARQEARPGPAGKTERLAMAAEMLAVAVRTGSARAAMWGLLWRIEALLEDGRISGAAEELGALAAAVNRAGGPVSAWHLDRVSACVAQASGRYAEAAAIGRRGFARMRPVEPMPATGAFFALQCALARHVGMSAEAEELARGNFAGLPRFRTMARLHRAYLQQRLGLTAMAAASYQEAGPPEAWEIPPFFYLPGHVLAVLVTIELQRLDHLTVLLERLQDYRGEHVSANGVAYAGPVELALGMGAVALGRWTDAVADLTRAIEMCDGVGAVGFGAEARWHLAEALAGRGDPPGRERAGTVAAEADRVARALGMSVVAARTGALLARLGAGRPTPGGLSSREAEVAALVAFGLTNRQIAERLVISERTAQNHVQHILTKLGFTTRSQIAAWHVGTPRPDEQ